MSINIPPPRVCPFCASPDPESAEVRAGPHRARVVCRSCGRQLKWEPAPMTPERARSYRLWFGKYRNMTLGEIAATRDGPRYLAWLRSEPGMKWSVVAAVNCLLSHPARRD
jgi:transcription elongation factor Elf1